MLTQLLAFVAICRSPLRDCCDKGDSHQDNSVNIDHEIQGLHPTEHNQVHFLFFRRSEALTVILATKCYQQGWPRLSLNSL